MTLNRQESLGYEFPEMLTTKTDVELPLTIRQVEQWLSGLSMLNVEKLSTQIPLYLYKFNRRSMPDKERFLILERLRPVVAHLDDCLIKQIKGGNLTLSKQYRDAHAITRELFAGMAIGYQRLLWNKAKGAPNIFNRGKYSLLAERAMYYLGEKIRVSFILNVGVPNGTWKALYSSYAFTVSHQLNTRKILDQFAFHQGKKDTIDSLFSRTLLLAMSSPYSLRGGELDQIYYSLEQWLSDIKLNPKVEAHGKGYIIDYDRDLGPIYVDDISPKDNMFQVDSRELVNKLKTWLESDIAPASSASKGMSSKLLKLMIVNLEMSMRRSNDRIKSSGEPVEIVIGFQNVSDFLGQIKSEKTTNKPKVKAKFNAGNTENSQTWQSPLAKEKDIHELQFYQTDSILIKEKPDKKKKPKKEEPAVRLHIFTVENESESGVCLSCENLHSDGMYIGELLLIRGFEMDVWTLGVVRWMKFAENKLSLGVYLLSSNVEHVVIDTQSVSDIVEIDALWLANPEQGDTLLLSSSEFKTGDYVELSRGNEQVFVTLSEAIWYSGEGFVQYKFDVEGHEQVLPSKKADYLIAD